MKKNLPKLVASHSLLLIFLSVTAQTNLVPFSNCPGVSVAITRPGFNATLLPHQIYLIDSLGKIQPSGNPINLQINGFGLNTFDGFLYGMYQAYNVANPFLTRVDKNGNYQPVGTLLGPSLGTYKVGIVNTAAGTMDDRNNYYFTAAVIDLQNILLPPDLYVGKVENVSSLKAGDQPLTIKYTKVNMGTCADELQAVLMNPKEGAFQDIAYNPVNRNIYTFIPAPGTAPTPGKIAWFNPDTNPTLSCIDPATPNTPTNDLSGLYFGRDTMLYILTIDGKYYKGNTNTGKISFINQTSLPLQDGNLRGDMASCVGAQPAAASPGCSGEALAITRVGTNSTHAPYQIYKIDSTGKTQAIGNPINMQINGFGLNSVDGFLYGLHESENVINPFFARVDENGTVQNIGNITPPSAPFPSVSVVNTAAGTMDGADNFYFTAMVIDTSFITTLLPKLYLGTIAHVSQLQPGSALNVQYKQVLIGTCAADILKVVMNPAKGLMQDIAYDPVNGYIYTVVPAAAVSPAPARIAYFAPSAALPVLNCITPSVTNMPVNDLSGLYFDQKGQLYMLTTDGKFYKGSVSTGVIGLITQTKLPLQDGNLRGDMASCVMTVNAPRVDASPQAFDLRVAPNPVHEGRFLLSVNAETNERMQMQVIDARGNIILSNTLAVSTGYNQFSVDVSQWQAGLFTVVLIDRYGKRRTIRFIKL